MFTCRFCNPFVAWRQWNVRKLHVARAEAHRVHDRPRRGASSPSKDKASSLCNERGGLPACNRNVLVCRRLVNIYPLPAWSRKCLHACSFPPDIQPGQAAPSGSTHASKQHGRSRQLAATTAARFLLGQFSVMQWASPAKMGPAKVGLPAMLCTQLCLLFFFSSMNGNILYSQSTQRYNTSSSVNPRPQKTPGRMTSGSYSFQENFHTTPSTSSKQHYHTSASNSQTMLSSSGGNRAQSSYPRRAEHSQPSTNSWRPGGFSPYFPSNKGPSNQPLHAYQPSVSHSAQSFSHTERPQASFPPGRAVEPAPHHVSQPAPLIRSVIYYAPPLYPDSAGQSAKTEPSPSPVHVTMQKSSHLPRVLTVTARGLGHWIKFKAQIPMLFEIIGLYIAMSTIFAPVVYVC